LWGDRTEEVDTRGRQSGRVQRQQARIRGRLCELHLPNFGSRVVHSLLQWLPKGVWWQSPRALPACRTEGHDGGEQQL
ncbi:hypothetical protein, partial [Acinetobacter baumannii]|uniref:hypothetical protein n=1 Tax=Acinetobacter baumannii TaxID=470 RepID=UPI0033980771